MSEPRYYVTRDNRTDEVFIDDTSLIRTCESRLAECPTLAAAMRLHPTATLLVEGVPGGQSTHTLLEGRHKLKITWGTTCPGRRPGGDPMVVHVTLQAPVHTCIHMQRASVADRDPAATPSDMELLIQFIDTHLDKGTPATNDEESTDATDG